MLFENNETKRLRTNQENNRTAKQRNKQIKIILIKGEEK